MHKLTHSFNQLMAQEPLMHQLLPLARSFDAYLPSASATREAYAKHLPEKDGEGWQEWMEPFSSTPSPPPPAEAGGGGEGVEEFYSLCSNLPSEQLVRLWSPLRGWLEQVLYETSAFIPHMNAENAHNLALGHPISIWLENHVDTLDACLAIGMLAWRATEQLKVPSVLLRLPILTIRYRLVLLPVANGFLTEVKHELEETRPLYLPPVATGETKDGEEPE